MALRIRRGTDAERQTITFAEGELVYTTDTKKLYVGDGTTAGGILAGGDAVGGGLDNIVEDITPQLGGDLDLNNFEINGIGDIDITGSITADLFFGDGSGLTNLPEGIVEGSNYRVNIVGDDSTLLVDAINNRLYAFQLDTDQVNTTSIHTLKRAGTNGKATYNIEGLEGNAELSLTAHRTGVAAGSGYSNSILLGATGSDGAKTTTALYAEENILYIGQDGTGGLTTEANYITYDSTSGISKLGIGTYTPSEVLDVAGNAIIRGNLELDNGSLVLDFTQSISTIPTPTVGQFIYDNDSALMAFYDGGGWFTLPKTGEQGTTDFAGPIIIDAITSIEREGFGADSTEATGAILYNSTDDRFQFFQAGSWVNLINNGGSIGQLLAWNGTEWAAVDPEITNGTIENANTLNGFNGSYYLDYNNLTNTPTTLAGYGIVDAVLSSELGSFTFTGSVLDTGDSGAISVVPATVFNSDVTVENDLVVTNKITANTIEVNNLITTPSAGTPEISSDGAILLTAATRVEISSSPLKMASFTTTERNLLSAQNGDVIYNTTDNKFQGYENGAWVNLV